MFRCAPRQQLRWLRASFLRCRFTPASPQTTSAFRALSQPISAGLREPASSIFLSKRISSGNGPTSSGKDFCWSRARWEYPFRWIWRFLCHVDYRLWRIMAHEAADVAGGNYAILNPGGGWPTKTVERRSAR